MKNIWTIHGNEYDLSNFVDIHPDGNRAILSGRGRDCTEMFESYHHWNYEKTLKILSKYGPKPKKKKYISSRGSK